MAGIGTAANLGNQNYLRNLETKKVLKKCASRDEWND